MSSDPQAAAFLRGYLRQPNDITARLVFADWLDETGRPHNAEWARYIRAKEEAAKHADGTAARKTAERIACAAAPSIVARLTVPATLFVTYPASLLRLLPPPNLAVKLTDFEVPRAVVELMPESVARENFVLPLAMQERTLLIATTDPCNGDTIQKVNFILNKATIAVGCDEVELREGINRHYGCTETESIDCVSYESPLIGLQGDSGDLFGVFHTAFSRNATGYEMELVENRCRVTYYRFEQVIDTDDFPVAVFRRLLAHLRDQSIESEAVEQGSRRIRLDIPLLSGRRFPVCVTIQRRWFRTWRFRVDFEWDR